MADGTTRVVSVVLVNFRGVDDTITAVHSLLACDWPLDDLEIVVVENGSGDDSAARLRAAELPIVLVESAENLGFAGGCNLGVRHSLGDVVAFLNNDAKPDRAWIRAAVAAFDADPAVGAVASRVLDWEGTRVDYIGSAMTWYGMGYKPFTAERIPRSPEVPDDVLFGTGSAMFVRRDVYDELGGFDERYFMFFEDVDLGWRINLRGWRFRYAPESLAFHKHHASMAGVGSHRERLLLERNALYTLYKNLDQATLNRILPAAMALSARRSLALGAVDLDAYDLRARPAGEPSTIEVHREALVSTLAIAGFVEELPALALDRRAVQESRVVSDARIWRLFGLADAPILEDETYVRGYENIVNTLPVTEPPSPPRIVVITGDPLGEQMAGPAIRAWNIAGSLADAGHEVRLLSLTRAERAESRFDIRHVRPGDEAAMRPHEAWADVIVFQGHALELFETLRRSTKIMAIDIYDPMHLEQLEQAKSRPAEVWERAVGDATRVLNTQLARGDFFFCASERQRQFYLGQLSALGRLNPHVYAGDPDLRRLVDVVPFGLPERPAEHRKPAMRGVRPGIGPDDKVIIWAGGVYDWFDPKSLIRAVGSLSERRPDVRLFFLGTRHPHPDVPEMPVVAQSRALAEELGLTDRVVFFNDSWVPYDERDDYLTEADLGVSTHYAHVETTFSFRTRILDYLWAGLPMVVTEGDHFADLVARESLGESVPAQDVDALAAAIERVLYDPEIAAAARGAVERVREDYRWPTVLRPLLDFAAAPWAAGDRANGAAVVERGRAPRVRGLRHDLGLVALHLRQSGVRAVAGKIVRRARRRLGRG